VPDKLCFHVRQCVLDAKAKVPLRLQFDMGWTPDMHVEQSKAKPLLEHVNNRICTSTIMLQLEWPKFKEGDEAALPAFNGLLDRARDALAKAEAVATAIVA
jgi:hypothetical protein